MFTRFLFTHQTQFSFHESAGDSTFNSPIEQKRETNNLTKAQNETINRVIQLLERDPEVEKQMSLAFKQNFKEIISHPNQLKVLLEKMWQVQVDKLGWIEERFKSGELSQEQAIEESRETILHYTEMELQTAKQEIINNQKS